MEALQYADVFKEKSRNLTAAPDTLRLAAWETDDWQKLLTIAEERPFRASEVIIHRGEVERALYLIARGSLEVGITQVDGVSMSPLARIGPGSVIGEQSFFDGQPRSANVWAVEDGVALRLDVDRFEAFGQTEPALARDFLFAIGRVLSARLRNTTFRVRR